jgi:hypothetical protein
MIGSANRAGTFKATFMSIRHAAVAATLTAALTPALAQTYPPAPFFDTLSTLCGARFEGKSVFPPDDAPGNVFARKKLVANIVTCTADEIRVPFIVGEDRSRTWIIKRTPAGLELLHDHRHADGTPDAVTMYGGPSVDAGTSAAQSFSSSTHTHQVFPGSETNIWTISVAPDGSGLIYNLDRHGKPRMRAELVRVAIPR